MSLFYRLPAWTVACAILPACHSLDDAALGRTDPELAADLAERISDSQTWEQPATWEGRQWHSDGSPHGPWVDVRANPVALDGLGGRLRPGAILTKHLSDSEDGPDGVVVFAMWKLADYGESYDGWFFANWQEGVVMELGESSFCASCHSGGDDFVRSVSSHPGTPPR